MYSMIMCHYREVANINPYFNGRAIKQAWRGGGVKRSLRRTKLCLAFFLARFVLKLGGGKKESK